jgi:translation initiation factor 2 alpha subunit (eIF-2alpha)
MKFAPAARLVALACIAALMWSASASASTAAKTVSPSAYIHSFCSALRSFESALKSARVTLRSELSSSTSLDQVKGHLVDHLGSLSSSADTLIAAVRKAGVPKVKNGAKLAASVLSVMVKIKSTFVRSRTEAENLSTDDPNKFSTALVKAQDNVTANLDKARSDFSRIRTKYPSFSGVHCGGLI